MFQLENLKKMREGITQGELVAYYGDRIGFSNGDDTFTEIARIGGDGNRKAFIALPSILSQLIEMIEEREELRGKIEGMFEKDQEKIEKYFRDGMRVVADFHSGRKEALMEVLSLLNSPKEE